MSRKRTDRDLDIDHSDTSSSSSTSTSSSSNEGMFKAHTPFVLELHDIRKDDPTPADAVPPLQAAAPAVAPVGPAEAKIKKHKKKKKHAPAKDTSNASTDSLSEGSSVAPSSTDVKEEFYDAHESYHAIMPGANQLGEATTLAVAAVETATTPKVETTHLPATSEPQSPDSVVQEPSPIVKPTTPP